MYRVMIRICFDKKKCNGSLNTGRTRSTETANSLKSSRNENAMSNNTATEVLQRTQVRKNLAQKKKLTVDPSSSSHLSVGWRVAYAAAALAAISAVLIFDLLNGGPCGELLRPVFDYALPAINDPDRGKTTEELVRSRGFEFERHYVTTEDGYIIEMHRIFDASKADRPALVLGAPLFCSSTISLVDFRNNTPAYQFADAGYDVWLTNARGNRFGMRHTSLDLEKDKLAFYDFTLVDIGEKDLAAQIDHAIKITGKPKVHAVGISQGAASLFALLSKRPSYNEKLHGIVSYGGFRSVCFADNTGVVLFSKLAWPLSDFILKVESLAAIWTDMSPADALCARTGDLCGKLLTYVGFKSDHYLNVSRFGVYLEHVPAGTSLKTFAYYAQTRQIGCDGSVREFDYDQGPITSLLIKLGLRESMNMKRYGTAEPPLLDPQNIRVPVKMYYSDGDNFVPSKEVFRVARDLRIPASNLHRIADDRFSHVNFVFNKDRNDFVHHTIDYLSGGNATWLDAGSS